VALQQDGRASWTAIAEKCATSVPTVARRTQQLIADGVLRVAVVPELTSTGPETFFVRIGCRPGSQLDVAADLVAREHVRYASLITGPYDIAAELVVHSGPSSYPEVVLDLQQIPGVQRWNSDLVLHVYKVTYDWGRPAVEPAAGVLPQKAATPVAGPRRFAPDNFDHVDWAILGELRTDGRASFKSVASTLGLNESTVRRRFDRMINDGSVRVLTLVPAVTLGMETETLLVVSVAPAKLRAVADALARHNAVRYLSATLDGNSLLCEVIAPSTESLFEFTTATLADLDGVVGWTASVELLTLKRGFVETPWWPHYLAEHRASQPEPVHISNAD
jgi:DNA-binding Lrp family transcriptional regulator